MKGSIKFCVSCISELCFSPLVCKKCQIFLLLSSPNIIVSPEMNVLYLMCILFKSWLLSDRVCKEDFGFVFLQMWSQHCFWLIPYVHLFEEFEVSATVWKLFLNCKLRAVHKVFQGFPVWSSGSLQVPEGDSLTLDWREAIRHQLHSSHGAAEQPWIIGSSELPGCCKLWHSLPSALPSCNQDLRVWNCLLTFLLLDESKPRPS